MQINNKAFTLLELLGVILILGIIAVIVVTLTNRLSNSAKTSLSNTQTEIILSAAKNWALENNGEVDDDIKSNGEYKLTFSKLADDGYIDNKDIINPKNNQKINGCIIITSQGNKYKYTLEDTKNC